ncbi:tRNA (adenosine(37)-N6)-threonylcarbamoyltransferase complex ATPase subunit type 1 TsaE [Candidatus Dependentiae bacterium]|nr:tRNA (adenosine(37)-N6)-threonylcarbamoyltransferase complex ATPase subunit type 1 TsaE [Candidatus Dependentiae bacterium]
MDMQETAISISLLNHHASIEKYVLPLAKAGNILLLQGQLGAGKTTLVKALMHQLGIVDTISSPTFSYVNTYALTAKHDLVVHHFDLYRLNSLDEFIMQGFDEFLQQKNALVIIEWPEILLPFFDQHKNIFNKIFLLNLKHDFSQQDIRHLTLSCVKQR